jgi:hypothetical protein
MLGVMTKIDNPKDYLVNDIITRRINQNKTRQTHNRAVIARIKQADTGKITIEHVPDLKYSHTWECLQHIYQQLAPNKTKGVFIGMRPKVIVGQELDWFQKNYTALKNTFPGEWVAIVGDQVVCHGASFSEVLIGAKDLGHLRPFMTMISSEGWRQF